MTKKTPDHLCIDPGLPDFSSDCFCRPLSGRTCKAINIQAGLLTHGSSLPAAPSRQHCQWRDCGVRPRLQRRARPRFSRGSPFSSMGAPENSCFNKGRCCSSCQAIFTATIGFANGITSIRRMPAITADWPSEAEISDIVSQSEKVASSGHGIPLNIGVIRIEQVGDVPL